jgi:hypothetical protein
MTTRAKTLPRGAHRRRIAHDEDQPASPAPAPAAEPLLTTTPEEAPTSTGSSYRFALIWFGIPIAILVAAVIFRVRCGGVS